MAKFKVGDMVLITVPETVTNVKIKGLNGGAFPVSAVCYLGAGAPVYIIEGCALLESHLERVESSAPGEACTKQEPQQRCKKLDIELVGSGKKELPDIDWEKRRWEFYKEILIQHPNYDPPVAIKLADESLEFYKQTLK